MPKARNIDGQLIDLSALAGVAILRYRLRMTGTQAQILELIASLSLCERREIVQTIQQLGLLEETFYDRMNPEQRTRLSAGIAQADRGEGELASTVFERLLRGQKDDQ